MSNYIDITKEDENGDTLDQFTIRISDHNATGSGTPCDKYIYVDDKTWLEIKKEVMDLHISIYQKFSYDMKYLRPPKGEFSEKSIIETNNLGYKTVMWSFAYEDWNEKNQPNEEDAKKKILNNLHNGEIMLLHGNSKTNTNILDAVIKEAKNGGYEFKSLDEFEK